MREEMNENGPVLPVFGTLRTAAAHLVRLRTELPKALLLPLSLCFGLGMGLGLMAPGLPGGLLLVLSVTAVLVSGALFAIPCHRLILNRVPENSDGWLVFTRGNVIRYALTALGLSVIAMIIGLPIAVPLAFSDYPSLMYLAALPTAYVLARLCLSLPAAAVADPLNLDGAWDVSRGNGWRLAIVVVLVPSLVSWPVQLIPEASMTLWLAGIVLLFQLLAGIYGVAVLSESYRALGAAEWRPEAPAAAQRD